LGNRSDQQSLADPGRTLEKNVAAADEADEKLVDDVMLTEHGLADFVSSAAKQLQQISEFDLVGR
jgi:hypothetical protein